VGERSQVVGDERGVLMGSDGRPAAQAGTATLRVDDAHIEGKSGAAIAVEATAAPVNASILVHNGATLVGGNGAILEAGADTQVAFTAANTTLAGDIRSAEGSITGVTLQDNARLTGNMTGVSALAINSGARWHMTQSTAVADVSLNGGHIELGGSRGNFRELTLDTLGGQGSFGLGTDLAAGEGDKLVVKGEVSGNHLLAIQNTGTDVAQGQAPLTVVQTGGGDGRFGVIGGQVDLGTFVYDLKQIGDRWQLVQRPGDVVAPGTRSVLGLFSAAPSVWYGELSSLQGRMGEWANGVAASASRGYGAVPMAASSTCPPLPAWTISEPSRGSASAPMPRCRSHKVTRWWVCRRVTARPAWTSTQAHRARSIATMSASTPLGRPTMAFMWMHWPSSTASRIPLRCA
jgi:hypothetical protein